MITDIKDLAWDSLSNAEKNCVLYKCQEEMPEEFLQTGHNIKNSIREEPP